MRQHREIPTEGGKLVFATTSAFDPSVTVGRGRYPPPQGRAEQHLDRGGLEADAELLRRLQPGTHPEIEVGRFLTEAAGFPHTPALLGTLEQVAEDGTRTALGVPAEVRPQSGRCVDPDAGSPTPRLRDRGARPESEALSPEEAFRDHMRWADLLGQRTAQMHVAFAMETDDPAFEAEAFEEGDLAVLAREMPAIRRSAPSGA